MCMCVRVRVRVRVRVGVGVCVCVCVHMFMTAVVFVAVISTEPWWKFLYGTIVLSVCLVICLVGAGTIICLSYCTCIHIYHESTNYTGINFCESAQFSKCGSKRFVVWCLGDVSIYTT